MFRPIRLAPLVLLAAEQCGPTPREEAAAGMLAAWAAAAGALLVVLWIRWLHRAPSPFDKRPSAVALGLGVLLTPVAMVLAAPRELMWAAGLVFGSVSGGTYSFLASRALVARRPAWLARIPLVLWLVILAFCVVPAVTNLPHSEEPLEWVVTFPWGLWVGLGALALLVGDAAWTLWRRKHPRVAPPVAGVSPPLA